MKISGFNELSRELKKIGRSVEKTANEVNGSSVSFDELFNQGFIVKHSSYATIDDFFKENNIVFTSKEEFEQIPDEIIDRACQESTPFHSWQDMLQAAGTDYVRKQLRKNGFDFG
jgi:hypothetical protein